MDSELKSIIEKVSCIYRKYGIKSVTMDDVARELGMSKKTLYQYVSDKADLVSKVLEFEYQEHKTNFDNINNEKLNAIEKLFLVNKYLVKMFKEMNPSAEYDLRKYYPELNKKYNNLRREHMYQSVFENIEQGKSEGFYRDDINTDIISRLHVSRIEKSMEGDVFSLEEIMSADVFNEVFNYHIHGIANKKGIDWLKKKIKEYNENKNI